MPVRDVHIAELTRNGEDVHHAAARYGHFPADADGGIDHLLHAVDVGCKSSDDDALVGIFAKQFVKGCADVAFRCGQARPLRVRRVGQQGQDPLAAQLAQPGKVDRVAHNRGHIDFKVARCG